MRTLVTGASLLFILLASACTGGRHFRSATSGDTSMTPPYLELRSEVSVATLHFPRGLYALYSVDDKGYYYRAPARITQRSWSGGIPRDGGLYVAKHDRRRIRGYIIWPGGLTHVGNLSSKDYEFRY
jgi:hypothetical protein